MNSTLQELRSLVERAENDTFGKPYSYPKVAEFVLTHRAELTKPPNDPDQMAELGRRTAGILSQYWGRKITPDQRGIIGALAPVRKQQPAARRPRLVTARA